MKQARAKKKGIPRLKTSITSTVTEGALRTSLRRIAQTDAPVFDHSVPLMWLTRNQPKQTGVNPRIHQVEDHACLSPFILHLERLPSPQEFLSKQESASVLLNFLRAETTLFPQTESSANDLALASHEVAAQLAEDTTWTPAIKTAEAILAKLDLPEVEDEAEADIVHVEHAGFVLEETQAKPRAPREPFWASWSFPSFPPLSPDWHRALGAFVLLSFAFVLPLHAMTLVGGLQDTRSAVTSASVEALAHLKEATEAVAAQDPDRAHLSFRRAAEGFGAAQHSVDALGASVSFVLSAVSKTSRPLRASTRLIAAGEALAQAGSRLSDGYAAVQHSVSAPTARLVLLNDYASSALPFLEEAHRALADVQERDVPAPQQEQFHTLQHRLPLVISIVRKFLSFSDALHEILGGNGMRRYLVIFQNNTEMRATGGFMGSFAEMTVRDGKIVDMRIPGGGTYDLRGSLREYIAAPDPLRLLSARWEFQDANWFPDFPTSARSILSFYQKAGEPTVDGIVSVNASYVADLLSLLGDIAMPAYGRTMNKENFIPSIQKIVELEYDKTKNRPKAFIGDLAPKLLDRATAMSGSDFLGLLEQINQGLARKDIQLYFTDNALEKTMVDLGWSGGVKWTDGDYFMLVDTNLGGGKTDQVIKENIDMLSNIASDGSVTNTVTLTRMHTGNADDLFTGKNNVDYVRVYVPKGSQLLRASGFMPPAPDLFELPEEGWKIDDETLYADQTRSKDAESGTDIYEESGKTVFGNWLQTKPGSRSSITFTYRLPFKILPPSSGSLAQLAKKISGMPATAHETLTVQKQSGILDRTTRVRIELPDAFEPLWSTDNPSHLVFDNEQDGFFAALLELRAR